MMQKKLQKKLKLNLNKEVIDVVQFGSSVLDGTMPNDIDIAVIFNKIPLKEQLNISQDIKFQLEPYFDKPIHLNSYDFYSFFDKGNFAKESILHNGKSLLTGKPFAFIFSLSPKLRIKYNLSNLAKKDKVRFNYLLNGKGGNYGMLREFAGKIISPGLIETLPEYEKVFTDAISKITNKFEIRKEFKMIE